MFALGTVGRCLGKAAAAGQRLSEGCRTLVRVAAPKDARGGSSVEAVTAKVAEVSMPAAPWRGGVEWAAGVGG